ncbi:MAG TPA: glycosyltransferase family 4 protein [Terriglobales bacterium]
MSATTTQANLIPVLLMARELGFGGIERDVSKFARHLSAFGIQPHVACFNPGGVRWHEIERAGIPVVRIPVKSFKSPSLFSNGRQLRTYIRENSIRLVHAFDDGASIFGVPMARIFGIPAISSQLCFRELSEPLTRKLMSAVDKVGSGVFVNCEAVGRYLVSNWNVPERKIHVCYNGFERAEFHPEGRRRPEALRDASVVIGTVAVLREEKNLPLLVRAFANVNRRDPKARLAIVGSGVMKDSLLQLTRELEISDACVFEEATQCPAEWMRAIDVFVLTSRSESFSNAMLEAMACGCCPVSSSVGGMPELISDGETGFLFESNNLDKLSDALCKLALDPSLRERFATQANRFVYDHLTIEIAAERLASIYKSILKTRADRNGHA